MYVMQRTVFYNWSLKKNTSIFLKMQSFAALARKTVFDHISILETKRFDWGIGSLLFLQFQTFTDMRGPGGVRVTMVSVLHYLLTTMDTMILIFYAPKPVIR